MGNSRAGTSIGTTLGDATGPRSEVAHGPSGNGQFGPVRPGRSRRDRPSARGRRLRRRRTMLLVCAILLVAFVVGMIGGALSGLI